jgi:hypothetical protein
MNTPNIETEATAQAVAPAEEPKASKRGAAAPRKPRVAASKAKSGKKTTSAKKAPKGAKAAKPAKKEAGPREGSKSKLANGFSIAGVLGLAGEGGGFGSAIGTAFLGNTFSGISDMITHVANKDVGATAGDLALGGYSQGIPIGSGVAAKGIAGIVTDATVNAATKPGALLSITGAATELGEEGLAGPIGLAKLGIDAAIFGISAAYCYSHP